MSDRVQCTFCKGTGDWGHGEDSCEACDARGDHVAPPFGAPPIVEILSKEDVNELASYWTNHERGETVGACIKRVAMRVVEMQCRNTGDRKSE